MEYVTFHAWETHDLIDKVIFVTAHAAKVLSAFINPFDCSLEGQFHAGWRCIPLPRISPGLLQMKACLEEIAQNRAVLTPVDPWALPTEICLD
jgi:hypothetical protein